MTQARCLMVFQQRPRQRLAVSEKHPIPVTDISLSLSWMPPTSYKLNSPGMTRNDVGERVIKRWRRWKGMSGWDTGQQGAVLARAALVQSTDPRPRDG